MCLIPNHNKKLHHKAAFTPTTQDPNCKNIHDNLVQHPNCKHINVDPVHTGM